MEIITIKNWDEVSIKLNNHETLLLLQSLKYFAEQARESIKQMGKRDEVTGSVAAYIGMLKSEANERIQLHNELLPCFRSDYEHLMLEPIELS